MKVSVDQIRSSYRPAEKAEDDSLWLVRHVVRPISFYLSWIFVRLDMSANAVTTLSLVIGLIGCYLLALGPGPDLVGCMLLLVWLVLDHVDGNLARFYRTQSKFGDFLDTTSCYTLLAAFPLCAGIGAHIGTGQDTLSIWPVVVGGIASILNLLPRLYFQKMKNYGLDESSYHASIIRNSVSNSSCSLFGQAYNLAQNILNPSGMLFLLLTVAVASRAVHWFLVCYVFLLAAGYTVSSISLIKILRRW